MSIREYSRPIVGSSGCLYTTLGTYNQGYYGRGIAAPVPSTAASMEIVTVPAYNAPGYDTLTANRLYTYPYTFGSGMSCSDGGCGVAGNCTGYFGIRSAYPSYPSNCSKFTSRLCG